MHSTQEVLQYLLPDYIIFNIDPYMGLRDTDSLDNSSSPTRTRVAARRRGAERQPLPS